MVSQRHPFLYYDISRVDLLPSSILSSRSDSLASSPIEIVDYSSSNFKPLVLHDIVVSDALISLLKKGPTFSPTPLNPPDLAVIQENIDDWK